MGTEFHANTIHAERDLAGRDIVHNYNFVFRVFGAEVETLSASEGQILNFLESYLGTQDHPVPFGGRDSELLSLDNWLENGSPYGLLIAPAGRGKSALITHWLARLADRGMDAVRLIFIPISIRYRTNLEGTVLATLSARLSQHYEIEPPAQNDMEYLSHTITDRLRRPPPGGETILIVLDGLDEAINWELRSDLFPPIPPKHIRVLVSGRPVVGDPDPSAWRARLNWSPSVAHVFDLDLLRESDLPEIVKSAGDAYKSRSKDKVFLKEFFRITQGDPLLIRLYLDELLPVLEEEAPLSPEVLATIEPGIDSVFHLMYEEQQRTWKDSMAFPAGSARELIKACSTALGPLTSSDLVALSPKILPDSDSIEQAALLWRRLLIGDGITQGYTFTHPRLAENRAKKLTQQERNDWNMRYLEYGRRIRKALYSDQLAASDAPRYVVQYHGAHLNNLPSHREEIYALLHPRWLDAWISIESSVGGFYNDVAMAWRQAVNIGFEEFGWIFRAAITRASLGSTVSNLYGQALEAILDAGAIDAQRALSLARQHIDPTYRAATLGVTARFVTPRTEQLAVWREFFQVLRGVPDENGYRSFLIRDIAPRVPAELAKECLAVVNGTHGYKLAAWLGVLPLLQGSELDDAIKQAMLSVSDDNSIAVIGIAEIARRIPVPYQEHVLNEARARAEHAEDGSPRAMAFAAIADLSENDRDSMFDKAIEAADLSRNLHSQARAYRDLSKQLNSVTTREAPILIRGFSGLDDDELTEAYLTLATRLQDPAVIETTLETVDRRYLTKSQGFKVMLVLADALPHASQSRKIWLEHCWKLYANPKDIMDRVAYITTLGADAENLLDEFFKELEEATEFDRDRVLGEYAGKLFVISPDCTSRLVASVGDLSIKRNALIEGARMLSGTSKLRIAKAAMEAFSQIADSASRALFTVRAAKLIPQDKRQPVLQQALYEFDTLEQKERASLLGYAIPLLQRTDLPHGIQLVSTIEDTSTRTRLACELAWLLPEEKRQAVIEGLITEEDTSMANLPQDFLTIFTQPVSTAQVVPYLNKSQIPLLTATLNVADSLTVLSSLRLLPDNELTSSEVDAFTEILLRFDSYTSLIGMAELARASDTDSDRITETILNTLTEYYQDEGYLRFSILQSLAKGAPQSRLIDLVELMDDSDSELERSNFLCELGPRIPANCTGRFIKKVREIFYEQSSFQAYPLLSIAAHLEGDEQKQIISESWSLIRQMSYVVDRVRGAISLSKILDRADERKLWDETLSFLDKQERESQIQMIGLAHTPYLDGFKIIAQEGPDSLLPLCIDSVQEQSFCYDSELLLEAVGSRWRALANHPDCDMLSVLDSLLRYLANQGRTNMLRGLAPFLKAIQEFAGTEQILHMTGSLQDAAEWWP